MIIIHHKANTDNSPHPANSLAAVKASLDADAAIIEIDANALADGDYLISHDAELDHETTGSGNARETTLEEARTLRMKDDPETPVTLLGDVVEAFLQADKTTRLQIDFKDWRPFHDNEPLERLVKLIEPLGDRVIISSMADWQLRKLHRIAPKIDLGFDPGLYLDVQPKNQPRDPQRPPYRAGAYGYQDDFVTASIVQLSAADYLQDRCEVIARQVPNVSKLFISYRLLIKSLDDGFSWGEFLAPWNIDVVAWTVDVNNNSIDIARRLAESGVTHFTSNTPKALGAILH